MTHVLIAIACGIALGAVLGLLGGGGGLIAVPLFGAVFSWSIDQSGTASMACVLTGSAMAVATQARTGRLRIKVGLVFGLIGTVSAVLGSLAAFAIPDVIQHGGLALLLITSGTLMLRKAGKLRRGSAIDAGSPHSDEIRVDLRVILSASAIGFIVGVFGISGGFLAVPVLTSLIGLTVPEAAATALIVVMINSAAAISARAGHVEHAGTISVLAGSTGAGAALGALASRRASAPFLAGAFGSLMLAISGWECLQVVELLQS
ncbi:MAG: sulfite exporter TauE/SafE family protein [Actinomycetes bacterium]